jgi:hypothetical protein
MFLVTYQLATFHDPRTIVKELQSAPTVEWWHFLDNSWLITTNENNVELQDRIVAQIKEDDRLLVVEIKPGSSWGGWLPQAAWEWMRERIGPPDGGYRTY